MNIVIIIPTLSIAGAEKLVVNLANEFSKKNTVTLISIFKSSIVNLNLDVSNRVNLIELNLHNNIAGKFLAIKKIDTSLHRLGKIDILHTHLTGLIYSLLFIFLNKTKTYHTIHNMASNDAGKINTFINKLVFKYKFATPISISNEVKQSVDKLYNINSPLVNNGTIKIESTDKIKEVRSYIYNLRYKTNTNKIICNIARITKQKNHSRLIQCAKKNPDILFICLGGSSDNETTYVSDILKEIELINNIYYVGVVNNISDYIISSDAIIFTSDYEGLPISFLESMSAGKPCISTPVGGMKDVLSEDIGFLAKDISIAELNNEVNRWKNISFTEEEKLYNNNIQYYNEHFSIEKCSAQYLNIFRE